MCNAIKKASFFSFCAPQVNFFVHDCCLCRFSRPVRKVSPAALEHCYGSLVVVLQSCCKVAPRPLEKVYGRPRKLFTEPLERCWGRGYPPTAPPKGGVTGLFGWLVKGNTHPRPHPKGGVIGLFVWLVIGKPPSTSPPKEELQGTGWL